MQDYKEFQFGWIIFVLIVPLQVLITYFYLNGIGDRPLDTTGFLIVNLVVILTYLLFYGMTTSVTSESIKVSFGIGIINKSIQLNRIMNIGNVRNPWYYGWGIRLIPGGMLYNISGSDGIEIKFNDTERVLRIGSKDSMKLKLEIEKRLSSKKTPL